MTTKRFITRNGVFYTDTKTGYEFQCYGEVVNIMNELADENEQLKAQLYCDDEEGVCNICKYHYLVEDDKVELGYYNSRCRKGHYECARVSLKYCEDFEKELLE